MASLLRGHAWEGPWDRPWPWLMPLVIVLATFTIFPFIANIYLSAHEYNTFRRTLLFTGFNNWLKLFADPLMWRAFTVNIIYLGGCLFVQFVLGLGIAILINVDSRSYSIIRSLLLLPLVIPPAVVGMIFLLMEDSQFGILSYGLELIGLVSKEEPLLTSPVTALIAVMLADIWQWTPFMVLIMLAGLHALPKEPFEAAVLDGARFRHTFFHLTLPMLRPIIAVALLIRGIDLFRTFDYVFVMTSGGPGVATQTLSYYTWKQSFAFIKWGYAATLSLFAMIFLIVIANVFIRAAKVRW